MPNRTKAMSKKQIAITILVVVEIEKFSPPLSLNFSTKGRVRYKPIADKAIPKKEVIEASFRLPLTSFKTNAGMRPNRAASIVKPGKKVIDPLGNINAPIKSAPAEQTKPYAGPFNKAQIILGIDAKPISTKLTPPMMI